jgi:phosphate transport system protein
MLRTGYHEALEATNASVVRLGNLLVDSVVSANHALFRGDTALAARVIAGADADDALRRTIETACIELIWKQQPVAGELTQVAVMLELTTDFQRINFYATEIAKHAVRIADAEGFPARESVEPMAACVEAALQLAVDAYRDRDAVRADEATASVDEIEDRYIAGISALQQAMQADPAQVPTGTEILFVLAALQRINAHTVNFAEHAIDLIEEQARR